MKVEYAKSISRYFYAKVDVSNCQRTQKPINPPHTFKKENKYKGGGGDFLKPNPLRGL